MADREDIYDVARYRRNISLPRAKRERSFWQDVGDNYRLLYKPGIDRLREGQLFGFEEDKDFEVTANMIKDMPFALQESLVSVASQEEFDYRLRSWDEMEVIRKNLAINKSIKAGLFVGLFDPINLIPLPTVWGMGFYKGAKRLGLGAGALTTGQEFVRGYNDPHWTLEEGAFAVGGSTLLSGILGGTIGGLTKKVGANQYRAQYYDDGADIIRKEIKDVNYHATPGQIDNPKLITYQPELKFDPRINKVEPMPNPKELTIDENGRVWSKPYIEEWEEVPSARYVKELKEYKKELAEYEANRIHESDESGTFPGEEGPPPDPPYTDRELFELERTRESDESGSFPGEEGPS